MHYFITFLGGILIFASSCKSVKEEPSVSAIEASDSTFTNEVASEDDCYYPRKTIRNFDNQAATILYFSDSWVIAVGSPDKRYIPCEMPEIFQKDGLAIIFSGAKLEIFPQEKRFALPLRLTSMQVAD